MNYHSQIILLKSDCQNYIDRLRQYINNINNKQLNSNNINDIKVLVYRIKTIIQASRYYHYRIISPLILMLENSNNNNIQEAHKFYQYNNNVDLETNPDQILTLLYIYKPVQPWGSNNHNNNRYNSSNKVSTQNQLLNSLLNYTDTLIPLLEEQINLIDTLTNINDN